MKTKIVIEKSENFRISEVKCSKCNSEWVHVRPKDISDGDIKCPKCNSVGSVVSVKEIDGDYEVEYAD